MVDNPQAAARMLDDIMRALRRLEDFPDSETLLPGHSLKKFNFRMVVVEPYLAFYRFIDNKVYVYRVLHGARNYLHLLRKELTQ